MIRRFEKCVSQSGYFATRLLLFFVFSLLLNECDLVFAGSCSKAECSLEDWGEWEGAIEEGTCVEQKRRREYSKATVYEQHIKECPSLPQECPAAPEESRTMCKPRKCPLHQILKLL